MSLADIHNRTRLDRPAIAPIEPTAGALRKMDAVLRYGGWAGRLLLRSLVEDIEVSGREHLEKGPLLVMMNHTNLVDPFLLTVHARRPIQFLITEPFMRIGIASRLVALWGQIPKRKLEPDTRALRTLKAWCRVGGIVGLFPEGQFPWDGRPLGIQPGLSQLVAYLDVPVVTARLTNGDRLWPPWAAHPRRTKLRLEIDSPHRFEVGEDVEKEIAKRIYVDPDRCDRWPAYGKKVARGLARFLRHCPACGSDEALGESNESLSCGSCGRAWIVTGENRLESREGSMTIGEALDRARAHFRSRWKASKRYLGRGVFTLVDASRPREALLATGSLRLEGSKLLIDDFVLEVGDILAHILDWGEVILLRTRTKRLALRMPEDSRAMWTLALDEAIRTRASDAS